MAYQRYQDGIVNFMCEYARSGRAKCKACRNEIKKNHLKIGTRGIGYDHWDDSLWFHYRCFWTKCFYRKHVTKLDPEDPDIAGYCHLKDADKERVKKSIVKLQEHLRDKDETQTKAGGESCSSTDTARTENKADIDKDLDKEQVQAIGEAGAPSRTHTVQLENVDNTDISSDKEGSKANVNQEATNEKTSERDVVTTIKNEREITGTTSKQTDDNAQVDLPSSDDYIYNISNNLFVHACKTNDDINMISINLKRFDSEKKASFFTLEWQCFSSDWVVHCMDEAIKEFEALPEKKSQEDDVEPKSKKKKKTKKHDMSVTCIDLVPAVGSVDVRLSDDERVIIQIPYPLTDGTIDEGITLEVQEWNDLKKCFNDIRKGLSQKFGVTWKKL